MGLHPQRRSTIHRAREIRPERLCRQLHRSIARRVPQSALVSRTGRGTTNRETWRRDYNQIRPHTGLGNRTPIEVNRIFDFDRLDRVITTKRTMIGLSQ
jgi:hypothetical protein